MSGGTEVIEMDVLDAYVQRAMRGDRDAFGHLVETYANTVTSIVLAIVRDLQACEDIAQEVFLSAWANLKKLKNPASFLPWLRQTARNRANTWIRERIRERSMTTKADEMLEQASDPRMDTSANLVEAEETRILYEVIENLPEDAREVVTLYYREGRSTAQVAMLLDLREDRVRQRLSRARNRLRDVLMDRFGSAAARSACNAAFTGSVLSAMAAAAPAASAGTAAAGAGKAVGMGFFGKLATALFCAIPGILAGLLGIYQGLRSELSREGDPEIRKQIIRHGYQAVAAMLVTVVAIAMTGASGNIWYALIGFSFYTFVIIAIFWFAIPKLGAARRAEEVAKEPEMAKVHARELLTKRLMMVFGITTGWGTLIYVITQIVMKN